jgi:hypothetical protein
MNPDIIQLLNDAEKVLEAQRETLTDEEKIKFDKELENSDFKSLKSNLDKELKGLHSQFQTILNSK